MGLKVHVHHNKTAQGLGGLMGAVVEGLKRHGLNPSIKHKFAAPSECDMSVVWGTRNAAAMKSGRRCLVVERAYMGDRYQWTAVGFDGLNGYCDFRNAGKDSTRFDQHFKLQPWREDVDGPIVIAGQLKGDQSLTGLDIDDWCGKVKALLERRGHKVEWRAHPLCATGKGKKGGPLLEALQGASHLVTYSSNSAVEAVVNGIPAVTIDPCSMAYAVTGHDLFAKPPKPDRAKWAAELAWAQWLPEELANGDFWEHLKGGME